MRRAIGATGRALVTLGVLILLFVAYQLWGTGLYEAREQSHLKAQFRSTLRAAVPSTTTTAPPTTPPTAPPPPPTGDAVAILRIPKIGVDSAVVQGVSRDDLRRGPGHYPLTPLPGQLGNAAIAGHRTTYGAPFNRLDELNPGDHIVVRTLAGTFNYSVTGELNVDPTNVGVLDPTPDPFHPGQPLATLTLTTCTPKYSAAQRLVVHAQLEVARSPAPQAPPPIPVANRQQREKALSGSGEPAGPTLWWGLAAAALGGAWWLVFHRYHRWTTWVLGALPFAVVLFFFYFHLERLLPGNY